MPTQQRHYLDHASSTPVRREAVAAVVSWLSGGGVAGDPGRVHEEGRSARAVVETAREQVASFLAADPSRVIFTSGGTEAVNSAVAGAAATRPGHPLAYAAVEHSAVREACRRAGPVVELPVDGAGRVLLDGVRALLAVPAADRPALVNCQLANHEVGTLQPVAEIASLCRDAGVLVHCDAAAAAGRTAVSFDRLGVDFLSVSGHKFGGPPGVGVLVVRRGVRFAPLLVGGSEERGRRAGYENVLGIVGLAGACEALAGGALAAEGRRMAGFADGLRQGAVAVTGVSVLGDEDPEGRVPGIVCLEIEGILGEAVLLGLDRRGIAAHSGSACSSEVLEPSPVLAAMGFDPDRSLRLSLGWSSEAADVEAFAAAFPTVVSELLALSN